MYEILVEDFNRLWELMFFLIWVDAFILEIMLDLFLIVGDKIIIFGILIDKILKG